MVELEIIFAEKNIFYFYFFIFIFQITYVPQENIEVIRNTKIVHPQVITYFKSSKQSTKQISVNLYIWLDFWSE